MSPRRPQVLLDDRRYRHAEARARRAPVGALVREAAGVVIEGIAELAEIADEVA